MKILSAATGHLAAILALNEESVDVLAPLTRDELESLRARASCHRVAMDGDDLAGFIMAFGSDTDHDSVNFRWFAERLPSFLYVDRVVVASSWQCRGVGTLLYRDVFAFARRAGFELVTCEIDADPPNRRSARFHDRLGFSEVGRQQVEYLPGRPKQVTLRAMRLADEGPEGGRLVAHTEFEPVLPA